MSAPDFTSDGAGAQPAATLVSSCDGRLAHLVLAMPRYVFSWPGYREIYRSLLSHMPSSAALTLLVHASAKSVLDELLRAVGVSSQSTVLDVPDHLTFSVWVEDMHAVRYEATGRRLFVEPASIRRADDRRVTQIMADAIGVPRLTSDLYFEGGNMLVGDDFWLLGGDHLRHNMKRAVARRPHAPEDGVRQMFRSLDDSRDLHFIGSTLPIPEQTETPVRVGGHDWTEVFFAGNRAGTVQPIFHIDMFVTLAGRDHDGRPIVLVGDPRAASEELGEPLRPQALAPVFDDIAHWFAAKGFAVVRNMLPLVHADDHERHRRKWYFASYNNALVEIVGDHKQVWLASYAHSAAPELAATDRANRELWQALGFTVMILANCHPLAYDLGGLHCMAKCLARDGSI